MYVCKQKIFFALFATSLALHAAIVFATKFGFSRRCICQPVHSCLFWHHFCAHCLLNSHLFARRLHTTPQILPRNELQKDVCNFMLKVLRQSGNDSSHNSWCTEACQWRTFLNIFINSKYVCMYAPF